MPYNEIDIDGQHKVEGHKYVGGGVTLLDSDVTYSSGGNKSYTMTADGMFGWTVRCKPSGVGMSIEINGTTAINAYMGSTDGTVSWQTGTWLIPVKNGDIVKVNYGNGPGWFRTQFIAYR